MMADVNYRLGDICHVVLVLADSKCRLGDSSNVVWSLKMTDGNYFRLGDSSSCPYLSCFVCLELYWSRVQMFSQIKALLKSGQWSIRLLCTALLFYSIVNHNNKQTARQKSLILKTKNKIPTANNKQKF